MLGSLLRLQCLDKVGAWRASKHRLGGVFSPLEIDCFDPSFGTCLRLSTGESGYSYFGAVFAPFLHFARREEVPSRAFLLYRSGKPRLTGSMEM